ncbi:SGNH/GDSL hydrolase family protein [Verrucomicrobia bacterium]|nr:SGNH/GDSL hydrolase family protein [Verrucomicrobiota bacterium]MDG1890739.1 SGNH/GDSL hydrolase family protein [Verrucomicrobiota bacterium]
MHIRFHHSHLLYAAVLFVQVMLATHSLRAAAPQQGLRFADGEQILFLGDSITQDGRYVAFIETFLWAAYPHLDLTVMNMGVSAETVSNTTEPGHSRRPWVHDRVAPALRIAQPDWVFICYGMNDGNYYPSRRDIQRAYQTQMARLIEKIEITGARIVLLSPPPFDSASKPAKNLLPPGGDVYGYSQTYVHYDTTLVALGGLALGSFGDRVEQFVDIHTPLQDYITTARVQEPGYRYGDGVHPPLDGHLAFALAILEAMGENRQQAYDTLHQLTGVVLKTEAVGKKPAQGHEVLWKDLRTRFNHLSRLYRDHTLPRSRKKAPSLDEGVSKAREQAQVLRQRILEMLK